MKSTTNIEDNIITVISKQLEKDLNDQIDELIEVKTKEFRNQLITKKNIAIAGLMSSIEICSQQDFKSNDINFMINIKQIRGGY